MKRKEKYPYAVYATAFHGGRFISRHATKEAAQKVITTRLSHTDCVCGCYGIIDERTENPGTQQDQDRYSNPYAIGSI